MLMQVRSECTGRKGPERGREKDPARTDGRDASLRSECVDAPLQRQRVQNLRRSGEHNRSTKKEIDWSTGSARGVEGKG